jgi:peptide/nickel transport system substrate-binding protein
MQPLPMNELVKAQLEEVGFEVTLDVMDWNKLLEVGRAGRDTYPEYDGINISRAVQDPFSALFRFMTTQQKAPSGSNWGHYENPEADALVEKIYRTFDTAERDALVSQAHELFVEDALMLFVTHDLNPRALAPNVKGFVQAQSWFQDLTPIVVE